MEEREGPDLGFGQAQDLAIFLLDVDPERIRQFDATGDKASQLAHDQTALVELAQTRLARVRNDLQDPLVKAGQILAADHDLRWGIGRDRVVRSGRVGKCHGVGEFDPQVLERGDLQEFVQEGVFPLNSLSEGFDIVIRPVPIRRDPMPSRAVVADPTSLDLDEQDPVFGMGQDEVDLAVSRAARRPCATEPGNVVEDEPA